MIVPSGAEFLICPYKDRNKEREGANRETEKERKNVKNDEKSDASTNKGKHTKREVQPK